MLNGLCQDFLVGAVFLGGQEWKQKLILSALTKDEKRWRLDTAKVRSWRIQLPLTLQEICIQTVPT